MIYATKNNKFNAILFDENELSKVIQANPESETKETTTIQEAIQFLNITFKKIYAVKTGRISGLFFNWDNCKDQTNGYQNAIYKSFVDMDDAIKFMDIKNGASNKTVIYEPTDFAYAYVDGSFNPKTRQYGYGVVLVCSNNEYEFQGNGNDVEMASMQNVSGEILGAMRAVEEAIKLNLNKVVIYHDYQGIASWANEEWKRNKRYTIEYHDFIKNARKNIEIEFQKVKAHSGIKLNERVDKLAKNAVGIL